MSAPSRRGLALLLALSAAACARQGPPPGGPEDNRPPVVVATSPPAFANDADFAGPVRFEFDERISERVTGGELDRAVIVSPLTGEVRVGRSRQGLEVDLDGGFQPGVVYRVTLLPAISDLFGNTIRDPFEIVFSTGPDPVPTVVAGMVWDRVTGAPLQEHELFATPEGDASRAPYVARSDGEGLFALRYLPPGDYALAAFRDLDRDGEIDTNEPSGERMVELAPADTLFANLPVLFPDTTPAVTVTAAPLDSITILVELDDFMAAHLPQPDARAVVRRAEDSVAFAVDRVFTEIEYATYASAVTDSLAVADSLRLREEYLADSIRMATEARDTLQTAQAAAQADTTTVSDTSVVEPTPTPEGDAPSDEVAEAVRRPPVGLDGRPASRPPPPDSPSADPTGPDGQPLPKRNLVVLLLEPLAPGTLYVVEIAGVANVNGVPGGGGRATFETEAAAMDPSG